MKEISAKVGDQVLYFPNDADAHTAANGAQYLPATVVQAFSSKLNLAVTCMNADGPVVLRYSVCHKSEINEQGIAFWESLDVR